MGSFCSSKPQVSTYKPAAEVSAGYKDLLGRAAPLLDRQYPEYAGQLVAGLSPYTTAAGQGIAALGGGTQGAYNMAQGLALAGAAPIQPMQFSGEAVGQYLSPYLQNVMGATAANIAQTNAQQQSQLTGNAIQRGAFGGDRAGIAAAELARQQNLANNATLANIANQGYQSALGMFNQQQLANMQAQLQSGQLAQGAGNLLGNLATGGQQASLAQLGAQLQYGGLEQQQRQAELSTAYQQFLNKQQYPYQQLGWYGGLLGGAAQGMGGTTTTQAAQPSMFNQLLGAGIGLAAMGGTGGLFGGAGLIPGVMGMFKADGGAVGSDNKYAEGGVVGASPIAGMKAQEFFPEQRQPQSGYQAPRNDTLIDPNAGLSKMVNDIRTLLKPGQSGVAGAGEKSKDNTEGMDTNPPIPMAPPRMAAGGVAPFNFDYGLTTKDDLSQLAESQAGSGYGSMSPQMEAEASSGLIGAAHGGRIHYQEGGVAPAGFDASPYVEKFEPYYVARESGGNPNAKNPNSTASGRYQIIDKTFEGIRRANPDITDKNDPRAYRHLATEVATTLHNQGIEPTPQNMYMGMFLGNKSGGSFIQNMRANPDAPAYTMVSPQVYQANPTKFFDKSGRPYTMQETFDVLNREPGAASAAIASVRGQGEPGGARAAVEPRNTATEDYIPYRSKSEKVGLLGMLGVSTTPEERLALMQAGFKLAGTPGRPGVGLAAAADTYAKTLMEARREQRETAGSQAAGERERATAGLEKARELKERTTQGLTGAVIAKPTPEGGAQYEMVQYPTRPGERTGTQANMPAGTAETGPGTAIAPGAGAAPKAPTSPTPEVQEFNFQHGPVSTSPISPDSNRKDEIMRDAGREALRAQFNPRLQETYTKQFNELLTGAENESKAAASSVPRLAQGIEALSKVPDSGALVPGAGAAIRYAAADYFNTVGKALGQDWKFTGDALEAKQVLDKISTLSAQDQQRGLGREAGFWLDALRKASPNVELTKAASADILSSTIVANSIARDRAKVYTTYAGPEYSGGMGYNAQSVFDKINPPGEYTREQAAIRDLLLEPITRKDGTTTNYIVELMKNPDRARDFDQLMERKFGIRNLSRNFVR